MKKKSNYLSIFDRIIPDNQMAEGYGFVILLSLLFIISALYFYFFGAGIYFYQENNSLFIYSAGYLKNFTSKPGGLLVYAGNFLTQFYFNPLSGSLINSALLALLCIVFRRIVRFFNVGGSFSIFFSFLPSCLFMALQTRYDLYLHHMLGFLLVMTLFLLATGHPKTGIHFIMISLFPVLCFVAGSFSIIYIGLYIVYHIVFGKGYLRFILSGSMILSAGITFLVFKNILFLQPADRLLLYPLFINETSGLTLSLKAFSALLILYPLVIKAGGLIALGRKMERYIPLSSMLALSLLTVFLLIKNYDSEKATVMEFEQMVFKQDWDSIIKKQEKSLSANIVVQYYYNLALSEKGQLCSRMFFGPQDFGPMSLTLPRDNEQLYRALYFYYYIGLVKEAHHLAYELMVRNGYRPENIKMLIKSELINGNYKIAGVYINVLKKTLHYRRWALRYEKMQLDPDLIKADPELGEKIKLIPRQDFFIDTDDNQNIELYLKTNPDNKRAYEYKLARLLLGKDLTEIGAEVKNLKALGYTQFPRHIGEAIVALVNVTGKFPDMGGLLITKDTDSRFIQYFSVINSFKGNKTLLEKGIGGVERNTFWFYLQHTHVKSSFTRSGPVDYSIY